MASFAIGPLLGPIIGPVVGGVVSERLGWRWVFWIIAIVGGVIAIIFFFFSRETYAPVLLDRKTKRLRKESGNELLRSKLSTGLSTKEHFRRAIMRPFKMLAFSPICAICNLYVGVAYGYLYLMFTSLTPLFMRNYGFDTIHAGLAFLGLGVGSMIGVGYFSASSDRYIKKKAAEAGELPEDGRPKESSIKPEYRLPPLRLGAVLLPAGLFMYGWTADYKVHWIAPIIGTALIGIGNLIIFMVSHPVPLPNKSKKQKEGKLIRTTPVSPTLPRRHIHHLRRLRPSSQLSRPLHPRRRPPASRPPNVRQARARLGKQLAGLHCGGADSCAVVIYAVW